MALVKAVSERRGEWLDSAEVGRSGKNWKDALGRIKFGD